MFKVLTILVAGVAVTMSTKAPTTEPVEQAEMEAAAIPSLKARGIPEHDDNGRLLKFTIRGRSSSTVKVRPKPNVPGYKWSGGKGSFTIGISKDDVKRLKDDHEVTHFKVTNNDGDVALVPVP